MRASEERECVMSSEYERCWNNDSSEQSQKHPDTAVGGSRGWLSVVTRKAFVRGFKQDHADLWRKMRTDYRAHSLSRLVRAAKEYLELTGERSGGVEPVRVQFSSGGAYYRVLSVCGTSSEVRRVYRRQCSSEGAGDGTKMRGESLS